MPVKFTWYHNSPDVGNSLCLCSVCLQPIAPDEDDPDDPNHAPVRLWLTEESVGNLEARFHHQCLPPRLFELTAFQMQRDLRFEGDTKTLGDRLGITQKRAAELDAFVGDLHDRNASIEQTIKDLNERGDMTDAEWTVAMYSLGYFLGSTGR